MTLKVRPPIIRPLLCCLLALLVLPVAANARNVYVTNEVPGTVSVIDTKTNAVVGAPIELGAGTRPVAIAITPDGTRAYVLNNGTANVSVIDTATNREIGPKIMVGDSTVGDSPRGIAISPDGSRVYVTDPNDNGTLSVIDTRTNQVVESRGITVPSNPAVSPDGSTLYYVSDNRSVAFLDLRTGQDLEPVEVGKDPAAIALTPDGKSVYVANFSSADVSVIDVGARRLLGAPIPTAVGAEFSAMAPSGSTLYVANGSSNSISVIDTPTNRVSATIPFGLEPSGIAVAPGGRTVYVAQRGSNAVSVIDTATNQVVGLPIPVGLEPGSLAIVPAQPPVASFVSQRARPGAPTLFNAGASRDPDGSVATYEWSFGDGRQARESGPMVRHAFRRPGNYTVTLTLTDDEGCSTARIFTGQTAHCNGSAVAATTARVRVRYPGVRVGCPLSAKPRRCTFRVEAMTKRRQGKAVSKVAGATAKAGKAAIVTLRPKPRFAKRLAAAKRVLVKQTLRFGDTERTSYRKLKIVR